MSENRPIPPPPPDKGTVTGKVVDASNGQPLNNVSVEAISVQPSANTTTDITGSFTLSNIPQGSQTITVSLAGYTTLSTTMEITAGAIHDVGAIALTLLPQAPTTGTIRGIITESSNNQPLEGVSITVSGAYSASTSTGADGSFIISGVIPGTITITASKTGCYSVTATGTAAAGITLNFSPKLSTQPPTVTTGTITGRVYDLTTQQPITGAMISLSGGPTATTNAQGVFLINDIAPGTYQVTISVTGYTSHTSQVMITAGVTTDLQSIYLTPIVQSSTVTGAVTDSTTSQPIAGAEVTVVGTNLSTKTDAGGTYTISGINLYEFDLKASHAGYDSTGYHVKTSSYGTLSLNLVLNPTSPGDIRIQSLVTDGQSYPADTGIAISAQLVNIGTKKTTVQLFAQVVDPLGAVVDVLYPTSPPTYVNSLSNDQLIDIDPMLTVSVAFLGNTYQFAPGNYQVLLKAVDPLTETVMAEAAVSIAIVPSKKVRIVRITSVPTYSHVGATETVSLSLLFADLSNVPVQLAISHSMTTPGGVILLSGSETLAKEPDAVALKLPLGALTYTFTEEGSYPIDVTITSGGETLATATRALVISPTVHVEPSTSLIPDTVLPDGDKRIKVKIELKGVQQ